MVGAGIHPTSYLHAVDLMFNAPEVNLVCVFGPEHGFRGDQQAGSGEGINQHLLPAHFLNC
jgi:uncharacterized protein YbbC (DUF1343 family)